MSLIAAIIALPSLMPILIIHYPDFKRRGLEWSDAYIYYFLCVESRLEKYAIGIFTASLSFWAAFSTFFWLMPWLLVLLYVCGYLFVQYCIIKYMLRDIYPDQYDE